MCLLSINLNTNTMGFQRCSALWRSAWERVKPRPTLYTHLRSICIAISQINKLRKDRQRHPCAANPKQETSHRTIVSDPAPIFRQHRQEQCANVLHIYIAAVVPGFCMSKNPATVSTFITCHLLFFKAGISSCTHLCGLNISWTSTSIPNGHQQSPPCSG